MNNAHAQKQHLLHHWLEIHAADSCAPLFASRAPYFSPTAEAVALLQRPIVGPGMFLYVVCLGNQHNTTMPIYIGKAANPWKRWNGGHFRGLRQAYHTHEGRYVRWIACFDRHPDPISLICLHESHIQFPPLADFPTSVGAVEYQLISLAADAYPSSLLNDEGVAR